MKRMGIHAIALTAVLALAACRPGDDPTGRGPATDPGVGVTGVTDARDTQDFVQRAVEKNLAEIQLGKLAQERAANPQVRQFGQQMVEDHTKSLNELRQIARRHNIEFTEELGDEGRRTQERLQGLKGAEFDREYIRAVVDSHERIHDLVENRADQQGTRADAGILDRDRDQVGTTGRDPGVAERDPAMTQPDRGAEQELNQWAERKLEIAERHKQRAEELSERLD